VYADKDGILARQAAGLIPIRSGWNGTMPAPAWTGVNRWASWRSIGDMPHEFRPAGGYVLTTNDDQVRTARLRELVAGNRRVGVDDFREWQRDTRSWIADRLVPRLERTRSDRSDVEDARRQLLVWDRRLTAQSSAAALYVLWERAAIRQLAAQALEPALADDYLSEISDPTVLLDRLMRDEALLGRALTVAVEEWQRQRTRTWGMLHTVLFKHPLAVTDAIRRRFDVGPFTMGGYRNTLMATYGHELDVEAGPSFRQIVDVGDWDRSVATNAPGQSGSPASPHFRDLAEPWSRGEYFPLLFTDEAVRANAEATLTLVPKAR
jgi:penicillin amidase